MSGSAVNGWHTQNQEVGVAVVGNCWLRLHGWSIFVQRLCNCQLTVDVVHLVTVSIE
ncbi:MAG: hypothetical protein WCA38_16470 [Candidatus Acidiferrales bacterium]